MPEMQLGDLPYSNSGHVGWMQMSCSGEPDHGPKSNGLPSQALERGTILASCG